jgi:hypothetical protein
VRARALALLVPALDASEWAQAQTLLDSIDDPGGLAEVALPAFACRAAGTQRDAWLRRAIDSAASMTDPEHRAWAFQAFRDLLTSEQIDDALAAFEHTEATIDEEWRSFGRALILALALPRVSAGRFEAVHEEVLSLVVALPEPSLRRSVLVDLAEAGARVRFDRVVEIVEHESDPYERAMMAGFLIEATPTAMRPRLVAAALREIDRIEGDGFESKASRTEGAAARVLPYLADPAEGLRIAQTFDDDTWRAVALLEFSKEPPVDQLDTLLDAVSRIGDAGNRSRALTNLACHAGAAREGAILGAAFQAALDDHSDLLHDRVLRPLADALAARPPEDLVGLFARHRRKLGEMTRGQLLAKLHGMAPALVHADRAAAAVVPGAVLQVGRWWR